MLLALVRPVGSNLDPQSAAPNFTLTNGNTTCSTAAVNTWGSVRTYTSHTFGKRVFEVRLISASSNHGWMWGLTTTQQPLNTFLTNNIDLATAFADQNAGTGTNRFFLRSGSMTNGTGIGAPIIGSNQGLGANEYCQVCVNTTTGKVWISIHRTTSITPVTVTGSGAVTFITATGKVFRTGASVTATSSGSSAFMTGTITSYSSATGALIMAISSSSGSGAHSDWNIDGWMGSDPDSDTNPTLTFTPNLPIFAAFSMFNSSNTGTINTFGPFVLTPAGAATFTPWDQLP